MRTKLFLKLFLVLFTVLNLSFMGLAVTEINSCTELQNMDSDLDAEYKLGGRIDCDMTQDWNSGKGFKPIDNFTGDLNGSGHIITGLYIDRPETSEVGLFGKAEDANIKNLRMENFSIRGAEEVGGVVGHGVNTTVSYCSLNGRVGLPEEQIGDRVGGISGYFDGRVSNCNLNISIFGKDPDFSISEQTAIGGVVGELYGSTLSSFIQNSFVDVFETFGGTSEVAGVLSGGEIRKAYMVENPGNDAVVPVIYQNQYDVDTKTVARASSGSSSSYSALDFDKTWKIQDGYPALRYAGSSFQGYKSGYGVDYERKWKVRREDQDDNTVANISPVSPTGNDSDTGLIDDETDEGSNISDIDEPFIDNQTEQEGADIGRIVNDIGFSLYQLVNSLLN